MDTGKGVESTDCKTNAFICACYDGDARGGSRHG